MKVKESSYNNREIAIEKKKGRFVMIFKSFLLGNPLSLCMKIINSVVVVGLYYGFMTTFSIGPSYLFLLRARVMEEGTEKEVSATTGFIAGQLLMFISIYYAPLHLALGRPHTITVLVLPYLLFHFFWNNHKNFFDYGSTTRNSMRNLSIQCVFLNNLIFQLFNHFILPSSTLARLVNIYMFRCNNKMLFLTSSFVGWLIGHILFMKWVGLVLFWIRQNHSIRSNKYLVSELRNSMARIFSILLFITCVYYLGRMPSPIVTKKLKEKETSETEEGGERKEESDVETTSEMKETKQEQEGSTEENPSLFSEEGEDLDKIDETEEIRVNGKEKTKDEFHFKEARYQDQDSPVYEDSDLETHQENWELGRLKEEKKKTFCGLKKLLSLFFLILIDGIVHYDISKIINLKMLYAMKCHNSFFLHVQVMGNKEYPLHIRPVYPLFRKCSNKEFLYTQSKNYTTKIFINLGFILMKKKSAICTMNSKAESKFSKKMRDPLVWICLKKEPYYVMMKKKKMLAKSIRSFFQRTISRNEKKIRFTRNHEYLYRYRRFSRIFFYKSDSRSTYSGFRRTPPSIIFEFQRGKRNCFRKSSKIFAICIRCNYNTYKRSKNNEKRQSIGIEIEEVSKKVSRWSYKLTEILEEEEEENEEELEEDDHEIHSRRAKLVVIYNDNDQNTNSISSIQNTSNNDKNDDQMEEGEVALIRYSQQSDFRRNLIKGSMRAQRRKTVIWDLFQVNVHSPLFLDRLDKMSFFSSFDINEMKNIILRNWMGREQESELKISYFENNDKKEENKKEEKRYKNEQIEISEAWDAFIFTQVIRSLMLITQSFLRKYILLPSLIIAKNLFLMLLFQITEWDEDFKEWNREIHVKCTYNGVQLSETEFPQDWLINGIQIKILYPFCLKPWRKDKAQSHHRDLMKKKEKKTNFCFLTVWGMEAELPFGSPRKRPFFFKPIYKELQKRKKKVKKKISQVLKSLNKKIKSFLKIRKEKKRGVVQVIKKLIMKKLEKVNPIFLFELRKEKVYEPNENKKDFKRNNKILRESSVLNRTMNWLNYSLIEKRMKDLADTNHKRQEKKRNSSNNSDNKGSGSQKHILKILKRKNIRLMRKSHYFIKSFIEKIYIDILLCTITVSKINAQLFFESTKKIFNKSIYDNEINQEQEGIDETNQNTMNFLLTIKKLKSFSNTDNTTNSNQNNKTVLELIFPVPSICFLQNITKPITSQVSIETCTSISRELSFFSGSFKRLLYDTWNISLKHNKIHTYVMNEWKNWLKGHYQYDLSQKKRSPLVPKEWRNRINKHRMIQNKESNQLDLYQKYQFISFMKKKDYAANSFMSQKDKWKKHYRYDLFSYKYVKYINLPNLYISGSTLEINGDREIPSHFNISKPESFYVLVSIPSNDYLEKGYLIDRNTNLDRKYFDCRILHLCFLKNIEMPGPMHILVSRFRKILRLKLRIKKKCEKNDLFFPTIHQEIKPCNQRNLKFLNLMGMNKERFYDTASNHDTISNLETWFFPEFVLLFDVYKMKPWIIPIKSLFFHFSINEKSKNINVNPKKSSNKKKDRELGNSKQEENEQQVQGNLVWNLRKIKKENQKTVEEDYARLEMKKVLKKKQDKSKNEMELDFFLKRYLLFQLRWADPLKKEIMKNIRIYCLLLRLRNPKEIAISSIHRGEINIDEMLIQKDLVLAELIRKGIFLIEPICLSIQRKGKYIIYQTMDISLVDKKKHQTKKKYTKKRYIEKGGFEKSIARHSNIFLSGDKNHYDLLVPENILSPRRRRENFEFEFVSIPGIFMLWNRNTRFCNENKIRNCGQFLNEDKHINTDRKDFMKFKLFLWPNFRLEDVACMNRYWFDTNNSSRFSMSRIHMYSQFRINS
uniref:Protein TIC 214 n=1 Tax=Alocasia macrorrhizos TaxID=4456 RepID=A0A0U2CJH9_ALOMA|nr:Ycf1 [Alocasia macrorrhizos]